MYKHMIIYFIYQVVENISGGEVKLSGRVNGDI